MVQGRGALGWAGLVIGGILLLSGAVWGHSGCSASQAPVLFLLVFGGGALAIVSGLSLRKPKQAVTPVDWRTDRRSK